MNVVYFCKKSYFELKKYFFDLRAKVRFFYRQPVYFFKSILSNTCLVKMRPLNKYIGLTAVLELLNVKQLCSMLSQYSLFWGV